MRRRRGRRRTRRRAAGREPGRANLITDFLDSDSADFVEDSYHVAVSRHSFSADGYFDVRIRRMELEQPRQYLVVVNYLSIEADGIAGTNANGDKILWRVRRGNICRWQRDGNTFHMSLAQADHHK